MTKWTHDNTEGFTDAGLAALNEAQAMLEADDFADEKHIADCLNNAWREGMSSADLYTAVRDASGLNA